MHRSAPHEVRTPVDTRKVPWPECRSDGEAGNERSLGMPEMAVVASSYRHSEIHDLRRVYSTGRMSMLPGRMVFVATFGSDW